jgi:hypothetical protein
MEGPEGPRDSGLLAGPLGPIINRTEPTLLFIMLACLLKHVRELWTQLDRECKVRSIHNIIILPKNGIPTFTSER